MPDRPLDRRSVLETLQTLRDVLGGPSGPDAGEPMTVETFDAILRDAIANISVLAYTVPAEMIDMPSAAEVRRVNGPCASELRRRAIGDDPRD